MVSTKMLVVVIGAGSAGLSSVKQAIANGFECVALESNAEVGGTWILNDEEFSESKYEIRTAMYKGLRTNIPKEIMTFPDFPHEPNQPSFVSQATILKYIQDYANKFNLRQYIKFNTFVTSVKQEGTKWKTTYINKINKTEKTIESDAVMICNGHYSEPSYPNFEGISKFKGDILHSYNFKGADDERYFKKNILVVGHGPSGYDIALMLKKVSQVVLSKRVATKEIKFPADLQLKPEVERVLNEKEIKFADGTVMKFDVIIYCTGYNYSYPFLDKSVGLTITDNYIEPLYKHCIHIEKPTLCLIGILAFDMPFREHDLQAMFFMEYLKGKMILPSVQEMRKDAAEDLEEHIKAGLPKSKGHLLGSLHRYYYHKVADAAQIPRVPEVLIKIFDQNTENIFNEIENFREYNYTIIDDNNFTVSK